MPATEALAEAGRLMTICNACRYCEGLCAVFPAMEMRRSFADEDLNYLANLCHACGACYVDCQFAPPHEFNVNVPKVLAQVRTQSYAHYAWPPAFRGLFRRNGLAIALATAASTAAFVFGFFAAGGEGVLSRHTGPGAFYWLMPHNAMAVLFGTAFLLACAALAMGMRNFQREGRSNTPPNWRPIGQAVQDAGRLRYLDGGGAGCYQGEHKRDRRRLFHHLTFYGFLLCFASTSTATVYWYLLGWQAPYSWYDLPVVLGFFGGWGLVGGTAGLMVEKRRRDPALTDTASGGMDLAFLLTLFLTSLTGLALLFFRHTPAMSLLLAVHLGVVLAFFATLPYGKFVHGLYRFAALSRYAREEESFPPN